MHTPDLFINVYDVYIDLTLVLKTDRTQELTFTH